MKRKCLCNGSRGTDCDYCAGSGMMEVYKQKPRIQGKKTVVKPIKLNQKQDSKPSPQINPNQNVMPIRIVVSKRVRDKIQEYYQKPNQAYRNCAILVRDRLNILSSNNGENDVRFGSIGGLNTTNHGESRINDCVKYHLGHQNQNNYGNIAFRLVTIEIVKFNLIAIVFFGDHDETENWINNNKGYTLLCREVNNIVYLDEVLKSGVQPLVLDKGLISGKLYTYIEKQWNINIKNRLTTNEIEHFENIDVNTDTNFLKLLTDFLNDKEDEFKKMLYDTFVILRSGEVKKAISRIKLYFDDSLIEPLEVDNNKQILRNDAFVNLRALTKEEIDQFMSLEYDDVIVYLHPDQEVFAKKIYNGSVRISGVSGSGKTSILINRAVNLAAKNIQEKKPILVLSLNTALTELLESGIKRIISSKFNSNPELMHKLKTKIQVRSLWQLFYELICERINHLKPYDQNIIRRSIQEHVLHLRSENQNENQKENIEHIWETFYKYPLIPFDYPEPYTPQNEKLIGIHKYILDKKIDPCKYIKDEFDYIRSFLDHSNYKEYLTTERRNRLFPILRGEESNSDGPNRYAILEGLKNWEIFMDFNGISDYAHLTTRLNKLIADNAPKNKINPKYSSILIDESQDLGTNEMKIIRGLVEAQKNDLFLVGDFAQKIHVKQMNFNHAGLNIIHHFKLYQNYRNSMEILSAADKILMHNWKQNNDETGHNINDDELIQNPEFSNLHSGNINIIKSNNFEDEILNSLRFIKEDSSTAPNRKYCIVICGYSKFEVAQLKSNNQQFDNYIMLNTIIDYRARGINNAKFNVEKYFISDLEHCKGFEFDTVIIANANKNTIPKINNNEALMSTESSNNEISKFYVAMTRAKTNLIISYSSTLTSFLDIPNRENEFNFEASWGIGENKDILNLNIDLNNRFKSSSWKKMTGKEILFTDFAIGLTRETQDKILKTVSGRRVEMRVGNRTKKEEFIHLEALEEYINNNINLAHSTRLFGNNLQELRNFLKKL